MRPELKQPQKMVRIRNGTVRTDSGSVSPPAPIAKDSASGKETFFKKMRVTYGKDNALPPEELEKKIELLWESLSDKNKEKFIRLAGSLERSQTQKENILSNAKIAPKPLSSVDTTKKVVNQERKKNCKEIAKALDIGSRMIKRTSFADTVKNKMRAYAAEASLAASTRMPSILPPSYQQSVLSNTPQLEVQNAASNPKIKPPEVEIHITTPSSSGTSFSPPPLSPQIVLPNRLKVPPSRSTNSPSLPSKPLESKLTPAPVVQSASRKVQAISRRPPPPPPPQAPKLSYRQACEKYYELLAQSCFHDDVKPSLIQPYANIVEGFFVVREYTCYDNL